MSDDISYGEARRRFWEKAFCACLGYGCNAAEALVWADESLAVWEKRWVAPDGPCGRCGGSGLLSLNETSGKVGVPCPDCQ